MFKKLFLTTILGLTLITPVANAQYSDWNITDFDATISINEDSTLDITESITADFSRYAQHGIFRNIPVYYRDQYGNNFSLRLTPTSITNSLGEPIPFDKYYEGDDIVFKIGDPDVYVNETIQYNIKYHVERALLDHKDWDELYWNVTGIKWPVEIKNATATIKLPESVKSSEIENICFTGFFGSQDQNCQIDQKNHQVTIETTSSLNSYQGLTIGVRFPKDAITHPSTSEQILWFIRDNWPVAIPFIVFGWLYYLWFTKGRDPETRDTIVPQYFPPKDLRPTEVGTIIDERVDPRDISATILDLAIRGYLTIKETTKKQLIFFDKTDYEFHLTDAYNTLLNKPELKAYEAQIIRSIFKGSQSASLSDLTNKFYKAIPLIKEKVYDDLHKQGYFPHNPEKVRNKYFITGTTILVISIFFFGFIMEVFSLVAGLSIIVSAILLMIFSFAMPRKTKKGVDAYIYIKGLEEYISTAEKDRIKFFENDKNSTFEKILPYAMVLGIGKKWAQAFESIYKTPPSWYHGHSWDTFNTIYFLDRISALDTSMAQTFTSAPRSSASGGGSSFGGGGFSGGGFGGGGGGSW